MTDVGFGWATGLGVGKESAWGTAVAATEAPAFLSEALGEQIEYNLDESLSSNAGYNEGFIGNKSYNGAVPFVGRYGELDLFLLIAFGDMQEFAADGDLYYYRMVLYDQLYDSLTLAFDKVVDPWEYAGIKIDEITIRGEAGKPVEFEFGCVAKALTVGDANCENSRTEIRALIAGSGRKNWPVIMMNHLTFNLDVSTDVTPDAGNTHCIKKFEFKVKNNLRVDAFTNCDAISEPFRNAQRDVELSVDFATYNDSMAYTAGTIPFTKWYHENTDIQARLSFEYNSSTHTSNHLFRIDIGKMRVQEFNPAIAGKEAIEPSANFRVLRARGAGGWRSDLNEEFDIAARTERSATL